MCLSVTDIPHLLCSDSVILILRIYAMYDRNRTLLYTLCALLVAQIGSECVMVVFITSRLQGKCYTSDHRPALTD